jgi:hypothetical protein
LVEVGHSTFLGVGGLDAAGELVELGSEELVVAGGLASGEGSLTGEEHVGAGEHGADLLEDEGVELVGSDAPFAAAPVLAAGFYRIVVGAGVVAVGVAVG